MMIMMNTKVEKFVNHFYNWHYFLLLLLELNARMEDIISIIQHLSLSTTHRSITTSDCIILSYITWVVLVFLLSLLLLLHNSIANSIPHTNDSCEHKSGFKWVSELANSLISTYLTLIVQSSLIFIFNSEINYFFCTQEEEEELEAEKRKVTYVESSWIEV